MTSPIDPSELAAALALARDGRPWELLSPQVHLLMRALLATHAELEKARTDHERWVRDHQADTDAAWKKAQSAERRGRDAAIKAAAKVCDTYLHIVPESGGDELDRIGRYSNSTVRLIAAAISALPYDDTPREG